MAWIASGVSSHTQKVGASRNTKGDSILSA